jgi:hypothetical protein
MAFGQSHQRLVTSDASALPDGAYAARMTHASLVAEKLAEHREHFATLERNWDRSAG